MKETTAYKLFKKKVFTHLDRIERVENVMVAGMPDVNICIDGIESWIEIKCPVEPKNITTALFSSNHKVSQDQKNWHVLQQKAGGRSYFLICTDKRWILIGGAFADFINEMSVDTLVDNSLWSSKKPIAPHSWRELKETLKIS